MAEARDYIVRLLVRRSVQVPEYNEQAVPVRAYTAEDAMTQALAGQAFVEARVLSVAPDERRTTVLCAECGTLASLRAWAGGLTIIIGALHGQIDADVQRELLTRLAQLAAEHAHWTAALERLAAPAKGVP